MFRKVKIFSFILLLLLSVSAFAIDFAKCSKMLNNGWWMNYEYGGIDQPLTKATKKHGSTKATSATSTEGSTATLDPGYWSNISTSETQYTSSWGDCNILGFNNLKDGREKFFRIHEDVIFKEIALGDGEFLNTLASLSLCDNESFSDFRQALKSNMDLLINNTNTYSAIIDNSIKNTSALNGKCYIFN